MEVHSDILVGLGAVEVFGHRFHLCSAPTESGEELKDFADGLTFAEVDGVADLLVAHITWFFVVRIIVLQEVCRTSPNPVRIPLLPTGIQLFQSCQFATRWLRKG